MHHNLRTILAKSLEIEFQSRCSYQWSSLQRSSMAVIRYFEREHPLELIKCIIRVKDQLSLIAGSFCPIAFEQCGQLLSNALIFHRFLGLFGQCEQSPALLLFIPTPPFKQSYFLDHYQTSTLLIIYGYI